MVRVRVRVRIRARAKVRVASSTVATGLSNALPPAFKSPQRWALGASTGRKAGGSNLSRLAMGGRLEVQAARASSDCNTEGRETEEQTKIWVRVPHAPPR